ncbi:hypothetical protein GYMLUDRAFT_553156 [Collybiopsis luxurians FD-317 M1]|uniref:Uncharacterized protein n=1 Tax=Collybiopsis luxurians FD-317 M1 TaxID=944289 RepID=A0A0D0CZX6_9AGAR|nr:hypothetical protein GYMLUDRAFT_553156 [Collybiopsis luxurians FD-317 M1]
MPPAVMRFWLGHDTRVLVGEDDEGGGGSVNVSLEFSSVMDCGSVTRSVSLDVSSFGHGLSSSAPPSIQNVGLMVDEGTWTIPGAAQTVYVWNATVVDFPDGVLVLTVDNPLLVSGAVDHLLLRKGRSGNVMVFHYNNSALTFENGEYMFTHSEDEADLFRYSMDFGLTWTNWSAWEDTTKVEMAFFLRGRMCFGTVCTFTMTGLIFLGRNYYRN